VSDIAYRKANQLVLGDTSTGVDVDEFLSKCITYMRNGGPVEDDEGSAPARRQRNQNRQESDEESEDDPAGEALDWPKDRREDPIIMTTAADGSGLGAAVISAMTLQRVQRGDMTGLRPE
jgi:hypothetical protein